MWFWPGKRVLLTLTSGQTLAGVTRWTWRPGSIRLGEPRVFDAETNTTEEPAGTLLVPAHSVLFIQETVA